MATGFPNVDTDTFARVNIIVSHPDVDSMATTAAFLRHFKKDHLERVKIVFAQAHQVGKIESKTWPANSVVLFIGVKVNEESHKAGVKLTLDFVKKIHDCGHPILGIFSEPTAQGWRAMIAQDDLLKATLVIGAQDPTKDFNSQASVLRDFLADETDAHTQALLEAGHAAQEMNFETPLGKMLHASTASQHSNYTRHEYLVRHMAMDEKADPCIQNWFDEHTRMQANLSQIVSKGQMLGHSILLYDCQTTHDQAALLSAIYQANCPATTGATSIANHEGIVIILRGARVFLNNQPQAGICITTNRADVNLLTIIKQAGIQAHGSALKVALLLAAEHQAIQALHTEVSKLPRQCAV